MKDQTTAETIETSRATDMIEKVPLERKKQIYGMHRQIT